MNFTKLHSVINNKYTTPLYQINKIDSSYLSCSARKKHITVVAQGKDKNYYVESEILY